MMCSIKTSDGSLFEAQSDGDPEIMRQNLEAAGLNPADYRIEEVSQAEFKRLTGQTEMTL